MDLCVSVLERTGPSDLSLSMCMGHVSCVCCGVIRVVHSVLYSPREILSDSQLWIKDLKFRGVN